MNGMGHVIDLSSNNGHIDWPTFRKDNPSVVAVAIKYSESIGYVNPDARAQVGGAKKVGLPFMLYHYIHPGVGSAKAQADKLLEGYRIYKPPLRPMIDLEWEHTPIQGPPLVLWLRELHDRIKSRLGVRGILYTYPAFWSAKVMTHHGLNESAVAYFENLPLWIAHWDTPHPIIPPPWRHFTLWQYTDKDHLKGISGRVDNSYLAGPVTELRLPRLTHVKHELRRLTHR